MKQLKKRKFYNGVDYFLDEEKKQVILSDGLISKLKNKEIYGMLGWKKVGGSSVSNILCDTSWTSPFKEFCRMSFLNAPIYDTKAIDIGVKMEPKIWEYICNLEGTENFIKKTYPAKENNYDIFQHLEHFGGLPDGFMISKEKKTSVVIEIKTTKKQKQPWLIKKIPDYYKYQAELYAYVLMAKKYVIAVCFIPDKIYDDLTQIDNFVVGKDNVILKCFETDFKRAEKNMKRMEEFRKKWMKSKKSPVWNDKLDKDAIDFLRCKNVDEWEKLALKHNCLITK